ncbi:acyl carrier protein [Leucobacter allii]|uniref:Acyl carrier protein n=1 Tax=Leucobacter allii TaxID=2932247 RepID=A0ABY4FN57_9MICO|nr:acyl carrier protein [Leucobacter allii]UOQ57707.1 acyl carrier protein [Leucobacter allii]
MDRQTLLELVAETLEVDAITETETLEAQGWDSLARLGFIAAIDERLGVELDADALARAETVEDLHALVSAAS